MRALTKGLAAATLLAVSSDAVASDDEIESLQDVQDKIAELKAGNRFEYCEFYSEFGEMLMRDRLMGESIRDILPQLSALDSSELTDLVMEAYKTPVPELAQGMSINLFDETNQAKRLVITEFGNMLFIRCYEEK